MRDLTVHRCANRGCNYLSRWTRDNKQYWCRDHKPYGCYYVMPPPPPPRDGTLVGKARLEVRVRR